MRIVVVGAVAAGTSAAAKIRRQDPDAEIVVYERDSDISYSACGLPYYIGGEAERLSDLVPRGPEWFAERYGIDVRIRHEVTSVDADARTVTGRNLLSGETFTDTYDVLILGTGASPVMPDLPGIDAQGVFALRTPTDAAAIRAHATALLSDRTTRDGIADAVVLGSGFIGLEMVEQLCRLGIRATLVEREPQVMPALDADIASVVADTLDSHDVEVRLGAAATAFEGDPVRGVRLESGELLPAHLVVVALGIRPNTWLAEQAGAALGETGAVAVDRRMATTVPGVYAVGDVAESFDLVTGRPLWLPLGTTANKMGRVAGDAITGGDLTHRGILGTSIFRVFDLAVAQTGLTESAAAERGFDVVAARTEKASRSRYLGGQRLTLKTVADRRTGRLLGAQVVGPNGVDKRIDVLATAITFGARAEDLFHLDLAYAPPFSQTKDPIHYAGMALTKELRAASQEPGDGDGDGG